MEEKNTLKDKLDEIGKQTEQLRIEESISASHQFYQELIPQLNVIEEQLVHNEDEVELVNLVTSIEDAVHNYSAVFDRVQKIQEPEKIEETPEKSKLKRKIYELDERIGEFYQNEDIELTNVDKLFVDVLFDLMKGNKSVSRDSIKKALYKKDSEKYPKPEGKGRDNTWNKISAYLNEKLGKKGIVFRDEEHNYGLTHYTELMKYLSPLSDGYIEKIFNGEDKWSNIAYAIDNGATKQDVRDIFVLAGREKEFKSICRKYTIEDNLYREQIEANNGEPIQFTRDNGGRMEIGIVNGKIYHKNLSKHLDDLNKRD